MAIAIVGDVHGDLGYLWQLSEARKMSAIIQVGDLGFSRSTLRKHAGRVFKTPVYAIDGNHEDFRLVASYGTGTLGDPPREVLPGLWYVPRGTVLTLEGKRVGFLGGAGSIDYRSRVRGVSWFPEEIVVPADVDTLLTNASINGPVDLLITHCPPQFIITTHFDTPPAKRAWARHIFGAPQDWDDPSAVEVERAWTSLGCPPLYCGHMHTSITDGVVRVLDINEVVVLP